MDPGRVEVIRLIEKMTDFSYPVRWADEKTTLGDFEGREFTIDVFRISPKDYRSFLATVEPVRERIKELVGDRCFFVFHTPEATEQHYSHLFPVTKNIFIEGNGTIRLSLPSIGGTDGMPVIEAETGIRIPLGEAA